MRTRILTASAALTTAVVVAVVAAGGTEAASTTTVKVDDFHFSPKSVTVKRGSTVKFVWVGKANHDVESIRAPKHVGEFASKVMSKGSYTRKFRKRGTYKIDCSLHASIMQMTVRVK
jgi:plastocyanin